MTFEHPWGLLVLLALVPLYVVFRRSDAKANAILELFRQPRQRRGFQVFRFLIVALFLASLAVVAARPYTTPRATGDFVFLIDTSRSMQASNFCGEPTFLDRAGTIVERFLDAIPEGRFGIFVFDRLAFPVSSMTYDHAYLTEVLEEGVFIGMSYESTRTNLANALATVARKKQDLPGIFGNVSHAILLSDGYVQDEDWRQSFGEATAALRQADIRAVTVAIGNADETPIHHYTAGGACEEALIEIDGRLVSIPRVRDTLAKVAEETQGSFFDEQQVDEAIDYLRSQGLTERPADDTEWYPAQRRYQGRPGLAFATIALLLLFFWERRSS